MGSRDNIISTARRFLIELNSGNMDYALADCRLLLRLMAESQGEASRRTMVLPTPPPRKADKGQLVTRPR